MNSPFANIYLSLMQRILTLTAGSPAAPVIKYIDLDYGQLEALPRPIVDYPCVLIDFRDWMFDDLSNLVQHAKGSIYIKLATEPYDDTSSLTPEANIESGINILDIEWQLYKLLQGWSPVAVYDTATPPGIVQNTQPMLRHFASSDYHRPGLKVRTMNFRHSFTDFSAKPTVTLAPVTPDVTDEIE